MKHGLLRYLALQGVLELPPEPLPAPRCAPTPLAGVLFASTAHRHLLRGMHVCKVAGATPFRSGDLLGD